MKGLDSRHFLAGLATVLSTATVLVILAGLCRWHMSPLFAVVILVLSLAAGGAFVVRAGPEIFGPRPATPDRDSKLFYALGGVALALYAFLIVPLWRRPDLSWDAMAYHIPTLQLWAQRGYVHWVGSGDGLDPVWKSGIDPSMNGYPKGAELIGFLLSYLTAGHLANAWNFFFMPLAVLGIYVGARELGGGRAASLFGAALFAIVPVNVSQSTCGYVDTAYAAAIAGFFALVLVIVRRLLSGARVTWPLVIVAGELLGLALGVKPPATVAAIVGVGVLALVVLVVARARPRGERRAVLVNGAGRLAVLSLCALFVGGYWYARNYSYRDNPLYPVEVKIAGHVLFPGTPLEQQITIDGVTPDYMKPWSTPKQVVYAWLQSGHLEYPPDAIVEHNQQGWAIDNSEVEAIRKPAWPRSIRYQDSRAGGLGFAWLGASLPAALVLLGWQVYRWRKTRDGAELGAFAALVLITALCFLASPLKWWARYTIWIEVPGFIALGVVIQRWSHGVVRAGMLALTALSVYEYGYSLKWSASVPYFVGPPLLHATLNPAAVVRAVTTTEDEGCGAIFHYLPPGLPHDAMCSASAIAISPVHIGKLPLLGQLSAPPGARRLALAPAQIGTNPAWANAFLAEHPVRYVIWDEKGAGPAPVLEARAKRREWAHFLVFYDLGDDPSSPPVLLPKP